MRAVIRGIAAFSLSVCWLAEAGAATICVQNKQTGQLEPLGGGNAQDCVRTAAAPIPHTSPRKPAPAPAPAPALAPAVAPAPASAASDPARQQRTYRLKYSDVTVRLAMQRWFKDVNMQLAYEAAKDFPVPVEGDYSGSISEVMHQLMNSLSDSTYPLRACEYDNRVVLVVHRDEKCALEERS